MNKKAIVPGGTGFLGQAVLKALSADGYEVYASAANEEDRARYQGPAQVSVVDLADLESTRLWAASVGAPSHAMISVAGGFSMRKLSELKPGDFEEMFKMNAQTAFNCVAAFAPLMTGGGAMVLVGSQSFAGAAGMSLYAASKAAVVSLARSAALELRGAGIRVNAILPDTIDTPANRAAMPNADFDTWSKPEEIARVASFLASDAANIISGNAINLGRTV